MDYAQLAAELIRAFRGRRSQAQFSRQLQYQSNIVQRWETRRCSPTASQGFRFAEQAGADLSAGLSRFMGGSPTWLEEHPPTTPEGIAAMLRELRGGEPVTVLARRSGFPRFTLSRWFKGQAEPKLPQLLKLIEVLTGRVLDFLSGLVDPAQLPEVADAWAALDAARQAAYRTPWAQAVLRAMELSAFSRARNPGQWIAKRLGLSREQVRDAIALLEQANQIEAKGSTYRVQRIQTIDTRRQGDRDPARSRAVKSYWLQVAHERLQAGASGIFGYNLMSISASDFERLRELHQNYFREMQALVSRSNPSERVVLFCTQLLPLDCASA